MNLILRAGPEIGHQISVVSSSSAGLCLAGPYFQLVLDAAILPFADVHLDLDPRNGALDGFLVLFGYVFKYERALGAATLYQENPAIPALRSETSGLYCIFWYSRSGGFLRVVTDYYGSGTPFYHLSNGRLLVGNRAAQVADLAGSSLHLNTFVQFINGVNSPSASTLFSGVARLPFDSSIQLDTASGKVDWIRQDDWQVDNARESFDASVDRSIALLRQLGARTVAQQGTAVDLTAGNDTRLIAAGLSTQRVDPSRTRFRVAGTDEHIDVVTAKRIASHHGWPLTQMTRHPFPLPDELALRDLCARADGRVHVPDMSKRLIQERKYWSDFRFLLTGLGLEVFRGWYTQYELLAAGNDAISYEKFYKHRLSGLKTLPDWITTEFGLRDDLLKADALNPVHDIDDRMPSHNNITKLEQVGCIITAKRIQFWSLLDHMMIQCPILEGAFSRSVKTIPWRHRRGRRLDCSVVEKLSPWLSTIPTDLGAPFQTLRPSNLLDYLRFHVRHTSDILARHYFARSIKPTRAHQKVQGTIPATNPGAWIQEKLENLKPWLPVPMSTLTIEADCNPAGDGQLSDQNLRRYLFLIQVATLAREHPGIRLDYDRSPSLPA